MSIRTLIPLSNPIQAAHGSRAHFYPKRFTLLLFALFAANTVVPLFDIPLIGLSITSVFIGLVSLEVVFKSNYLSEVLRPGWTFPILGIGMAIFLSIAVNAMNGSLEFNSVSVVRLTQSFYWLIVFLVTMAVVSHLTAKDLRLLVIVVGLSIIALGGLRLFEALAFGRIGPSTSRVFTQNTYGVLFSGFTPFALILLFLAHSKNMRLAAAIGLLLLVTAIGINGSRSSWLASSVGLLVVTTLVVASQRRYLFTVLSITAAAVTAGITLLAIIPSDTLAPITRRLETLERIEEDKSYATRILMQQKAWTLFTESPIFGVGRGEFRNNEVEFDFTGLPLRPNGRTNFNRVASHNSYAAHLAETGLVGVIPYAILLFTLIFNGIRAAIRLGRDGVLWPAACVASVIALSIHLWSVDNLQTTSTWFLYGLAAGMIEYQRRQSIQVSNT